MRSFTFRWSPLRDWSEAPTEQAGGDVQLLLAFGPVSAPPRSWFTDCARYWPNARVVYITAGGQIDRGEVLDAEVVVTGLAFKTSRVHVVQRRGAGVIPCEQLAHEIGAELSGDPQLRHVLVVADGLRVNGAALTRAIVESLPDGVSVSGGLASDGLSFVSTGVGVDAPPTEGTIVAIGLSGPALVIGTGSIGGWEPFGPERLVTRAEGTTVYELDGERALDTYRRYLGKLANELPGSALLFPLAISSPNGGAKLVRTILGMDDALGSLRFAGDVPQGSKVRLMHATNEALLDGALQAARDARAALGDVKPGAVLCISCVGRRTVLRSRIGEEIDEVGLVAEGAVVTGFYSNGEIAPPDATDSGALFHNQTMTVTAIGER